MKAKNYVKRQVRKAVRVPSKPTTIKRKIKNKVNYYKPKNVAKRAVKQALTTSTVSPGKPPTPKKPKKSKAEKILEKEKSPFYNKRTRKNYNEGIRNARNVVKQEKIARLKDNIKELNKAYDTLSKTDKLKVDELKKLLGKTKQGKLSSDVSKLSYKQVDEYLDVVENILEGDCVSVVGDLVKKRSVKKAWKTFQNSPSGFKISFEKYKMLMEVMGDLQSQREYYIGLQVMDYIAKNYQSYGTMESMGSVIQGIMTGLDAQVSIDNENGIRAWTYEQYKQELYNRIEDSIRRMNK